MSTRILKGLYQLAVYTIGILVLLAAVAATAARVLLPDIGMYRGEIEAWVSNYMELPVAIRTIEADWRGWTPTLHLQDIDLLNREDNTPIINFNNARISIAPLATLLRRQIVPEQLVVSGFELSLTRQTDGSIDIAGIETGNKPRQDNANNQLAEWLLGQQLIELQQIKVEWTDETLAQLPVLLADVNLKLRSDGQRLQIEGSSSLPSMYGDSFSFALDLTGNLLSSDWSAELFVQGNNINPDFWYRKYWPPDLNLIGGNADVSMWSNWENAALVGMKGRIDYSGFEYGTDAGARLQVDRFAAWFNSTREGNGSWMSSLNIEEFITPNGEWPKAAIALLVEPATRTYTLNFDFLKLQDLYPILSTLSFVPPATADTFGKYPLHGSLRDGRLRFVSTGGSKQLDFDMQLDELAVPATPTLPQIDGVSAHISGSLDQGRLRFSQDIATIGYEAADENGNIPLQLDGDLLWTRDGDNYLFYTDRLALQNGDISARLAATLALDGGCCRIALIAETDEVATDAFIRTLPYTAKFRLRDWLQRSVRSGTIRQARALYRGHTAAFPFDRNTGVFELAFDVSGATLEYSPNWPAIDQIDGQVGFSGRTMTITVDKGTIFDAAISTATATIPDVLPASKTVLVNGRIVGVTEDLKKYIAESPLATNTMLSRLSESLSDEGTVDLGLQLAVPLRAPNRQSEINGQLKLSGATLATGLQDLRFTDLDGVANFTRTTIDATDISARYDGHPVRLSVQSRDTGGQNPVTVTMSGAGDNSFITGQLTRYFPGTAPVRELLESHLSGTLDWQALLNYERQAGGGLERTLQIRSDLYGMNVDLPAPLSKHAYLRTDLEISKNLDDDTVPLKIRYGNILTSDIYTDAVAGLRKIDVNFGNRTYLYPEHEGVLLYGVIDQMALDEWLYLIAAGAGEREAGSVSMPVQADLAFNHLQVFGQTFDATTLRTGKSADHWTIRLGGDAISGEILIPTVADKEQPIVADLDYLRLKKMSGGEGAGDNRVVPSKLPSITAYVDSFQYGDLDLGEMEFVAGAADYGLYIDTLSFTKPAFTIQASGKWNGTDTSNHSSDFTIQAHAAGFDQMLQTFGYDVAAVKHGETRFAINAKWDGTPMDFSLNRLNGTLGLRIGKGQLLDIQPSAGRLFGLLSLQTLPRRLTLDFSDLFGDGMAFDLIEGNFEIRNGDAYTDDLIMKGPSVDILISGRTGLSTHDYEQVAEITPQISDSLAVASGFLGPMGIGIGTVLYFAGNLFEPLQDSINKIMKFKYSISGTWSEPVIEKHREHRDNNG